MEENVKFVPAKPAAPTWWGDLKADAIPMKPGGAVLAVNRKEPVWVDQNPTNLSRKGWLDAMADDMLRTYMYGVDVAKERDKSISWKITVDELRNAAIMPQHELLTQIDDLKTELAALKAQRNTAEQSGDHPYHGPVVDGKTVPDEAHQQFHRAIGDVLAGKIMPKAREQMRDALSRPLPAAPTTASTSKPMPRGAIGFGRPQIGIRLPV
jgi:hypothetical protein